MNTVYIQNIIIKTNGTFFHSLQSLYGLGPYQALKICKKLNIDPNSPIGKVFDLYSTELKEELNNNYDLGRPLKRQIENSILRVIQNNSYRGRRLREGLPVRGQRTSTNANTIKKGNPALGFIKTKLNNKRNQNKK